MALSKVDLANQVENILPETLGGTGASQFPAQFRNIIINGDMSIAQRGTSATGLGEGDNGYHTCDRWKFIESGTPTYEFTQTQDADVPSGQGFAYSLKMACTTADASLASNELLRIVQIFEGQQLQYLKYGTANATSLTASFWVKSNVTGDYNTHLYAPNATNRIITSTFTINSADTWEKKTITFAGDTAQTIINDNLGRFNFTITLLAGTDFTSTDGTSWGTYSSSKIAYGQTANVASSTSNYFNYTGIQLEAGTTASDFEFLPFDVNLGRCFRYYERGDFGDNGLFGIKTTGRIDLPRMRFHTEKRATPTITIDDTSGNTGKVTRVDIDVSGSSNQNGAGYASIYSCGAYSSSGTNATGIYGNFKADAEL